jgi:hypothetical protein
VAVIVTDDEAATLAVAIANVVVALPSATVTEAGTVTAVVFELDSVTTAPPEPAGPDNVTVPWLGAPPDTDDGVTLTLATLMTDPAGAVGVVGVDGEVGVVGAVPPPPWHPPAAASNRAIITLRAPGPSDFRLTSMLRTDATRPRSYGGAGDRASTPGRRAIAQRLKAWAS